MLRNDFLGGVVEGFYGRPWSHDERLMLLDRLADWGMNTYFYAPKDDLKHRAVWRECYDADESAQLQELIDSCNRRRLRFIYGLSPGLDIQFAEASELELIRQRFGQLLEIGCRHFALLFDDLPGELSRVDQESFKSLAAAQCLVTNSVFMWLTERSAESLLLFCPTAYSDRMDRWQLGGADYLDDVGTLLHRSIHVLWTGPEIVSREIDTCSIDRLSSRIGRRPIIWDNLFANDYDQCRLYCGPYSGRRAEVRDRVAGILVNLNNEFPINYVPLRTFGSYLHCTSGWEPRAAYLSAMEEWLSEYTTVRGAIDLDDLVLLGDCYYLPHEEGPEAAGLFQLVADLVGQPTSTWGTSYDEFLTVNRRIQSLFDRLSELQNRRLFYAWSRRVWDLKEELLRVAEYLAWKESEAGQPGEFQSESYLPGTYRGGLVAKLQSLFKMSDRDLVSQPFPH